MTGLLILGRDPNRHGFACHPGSFPAIREQIESGAFLRDPDDAFVWQDLQRYVPAEGHPVIAGLGKAGCATEGLDEFFAWLRAYDFRARP